MEALLPNQLLTGSQAAAHGNGRRSLVRLGRAAVCILALLSGQLSRLSQGQDVEPQGTAGMHPLLADKLAKVGDLALADADLGETLLRISELWDVNIVASTSMSGTVTGSFKKAPLHEILDSILLSNGYGYRPVGQSLVVLKQEELGNSNPMFETAVVPLTFVDPKEIVASLQPLASKKGRIEAVESANVLLISDYPDQVAMIRRFAQQIEAAAEKSGKIGPIRPDDQIHVAHFDLQYVTPEEVKESVASILSKEGKVSVIPKDRRLVVVDHLSNLELVDRTLVRLDTPRAQVRITALVYDVGLKDLEQLGLNWGNLMKTRYDDATGLPQTTLGMGSTVQSVIPTGDPGGALTFINLSRHIDLTAVVQALSKADNSRLLANPNVSATQNEPAEISIVREIPFQQLTQTQQGGNIGTTAFREAGIKLEVTPHIADDSTIAMQVSPTFSRLAGFTPGSQPLPILDKRSTKTIVRVANGQTLVIGGLRQRNDIDEYAGLPWLKDLKYFGFLFRGHRNQTEETELVVFIRPEIVTPYEIMSKREGCSEELVTQMLDQIPVATPPCPPYSEPGTPEPSFHSVEIPGADDAGSLDNSDEAPLMVPNPNTPASRANSTGPAGSNSGVLPGENPNQQGIPGKRELIPPGLPINEPSIPATPYKSSSRNTRPTSRQVRREEVPRNRPAINPVEEVPRNRPANNSVSESYQPPVAPAAEFAAPPTSTKLISGRSRVLRNSFSKITTKSTSKGLRRAKRPPQINPVAEFSQSPDGPSLKIDEGLPVGANVGGTAAPQATSPPKTSFLRKLFK